MAILDKIFPITIMIMIVIFSIIHLGVSIGIIVPYRKYGDFFRPQIGLSGFNLAISFFGLLAGVLGLISVITNARTFGKIVCLISGFVGILALASLVAAIVLNSKSLNNLTKSFSNNLFAFKSSQNARNNIDTIQYKYKCCGPNTWLDWANAGLNQGSVILPTTDLTTTTIPTDTTAATDAPTTTITATNPQRNLRNSKRDLNFMSDKLNRQSNVSTISYGGIDSLPLSFGVVLPRSCCTSEAIVGNNSLYFYCVSNANNAVNHFYQIGCVKEIDKIAGDQLLGFAVINSFMVVLAFVSIPILFETKSDSL